jgi:hypothetical protein
VVAASSKAKFLNFINEAFDAEFELAPLLVAIRGGAIILDALKSPSRERSPESTTPHG